MHSIMQRPSQARATDRVAHVRPPHAAVPTRAHAGARKRPDAHRAAPVAEHRIDQFRILDPTPSNTPPFEISPPDDACEREADGVADRVLNESRPPGIRVDAAPPQRLRRRMSTAAHRSAPKVAQPTEPVRDRLHAARGTGRRLPDDAAHLMASRFERDFSAVRIHTDNEAAALSTDLGARAFTAGRDIFFGRGEFDPATGRGRHLLAHELTHVLQQQNDAAGATVRLKRTFTPGRPAHDHKPGKWAAVQADAKKKCSLTSEEGRISCACAVGTPEQVIKTALLAEFTGKPLARAHMDHYLTGGGKEFNEDANLKDLVEKDSKVRAKLAAEIAAASKGHVFIEQEDYSVQDFRFAFGGIDRVEWEVDSAAGTVDIWFQDRYDFHPVGFGYKKFPDKADEPRITNCVHAAAVEMKDVGTAADFWMKGEATFPLAKLKPAQKKPAKKPVPKKPAKKQATLAERSIRAAYREVRVRASGSCRSQFDAW